MAGGGARKRHAGAAAVCGARGASGAAEEPNGARPQPKSELDTVWLAANSSAGEARRRPPSPAPDGARMESSAMRRNLVPYLEDAAVALLAAAVLVGVPGVVLALGLLR